MLSLHWWSFWGPAFNDHGIGLEVIFFFFIFSNNVYESINWKVFLKVGVPKTFRIRVGLYWKEAPGQNFSFHEVTAIKPAALLNGELFHRYFTRSELYFYEHLL